MSSLVSLHCEECDEVYQQSFPVGAGRNPRCNICGCDLKPVPSRPAAGAETRSGAAAGLESRDAVMTALYDIFGIDLREALEQALTGVSPSRQINTKYLSTIGKIVVDERKTILHDVILCLGPVKLMAVSASFGLLLPSQKETSAKIVAGDPIHGETDLETNSCRNKIIYLKRGVVSFALKAKRAIKAGAAALIVSQTVEKWPFTMTDTSCELLEDLNIEKSLPIPVVMVSQKDSELVERFIANSASKTVRFDGGSETVSIRFGIVSTECTICQEVFGVGEEVLKLHCRHTYHSQCVSSWLENHNTCPLCRLEMPVEEKPVQSVSSTGQRDTRPSYYN